MERPLSPIVDTPDPGHKIIRLQHIFEDVSAVYEQGMTTDQIRQITRYDRWHSIRYLGRRPANR